MDKKLTQLIDKALSRRNFLIGAGTATAATVLAGCGSDSVTVTPSPTTTPAPTMAPAPAITDADILNFALNLEYLEAEYYLRATTGSGLSSDDAGTGAGSVTGGTMVTFATAAYASYANLIAQDELNHVRYLRKAITAAGATPVSRPAIDLTAGFAAIVAAAGLPTGFSPFASEMGFFVGGFSFEDVGVTAYSGAAPLLTSSAILDAAAGFQSVEAYHAAILRTVIAGAASVSGADQTYLNAANAISAVRGKLGNGKETTLSINSIVAADSNAIAYARTTDEVLHIVYGATGIVRGGAFFPNGVNGTISVTAS